jgi:hypothetical protein
LDLADSHQNVGALPDEDRQIIVRPKDWISEESFTPLFFGPKASSNFILPFRL